jgi:hypothetical protein
MVTAPPIRQNDSFIIFFYGGAFMRRIINMFSFIKGGTVLREHNEV